VRRGRTEQFCARGARNGCAAGRSTQALGNTVRHADPELVATEWQHRCERFRARNRIWMIAAATWLLATVALLLAAFFLEADAPLYGAAAALLFVFGMPAFQIASFGLSRLLQCPDCGQRALPKRLFVSSNPATLESCESCGCRLQQGSVA
jgi:hypothetical protein